LSFLGLGDIGFPSQGHARSLLGHGVIYSYI